MNTFLQVRLDDSWMEGLHFLLPVAEVTSERDVTFYDGVRAILTVGAATWHGIDKGAEHSDEVR